MTHLALLRGINVGGKAPLPMKELAAIFAAAGASHVQTYIQSGNVLFESRRPEPLIAQVTAEIAQRYGYPGRIVLRSAEEMQAIHQSHALPTVSDSPPPRPDPRHVYFLADWPDPVAVQELDPQRSPGDRFTVLGREIYLHLPAGMARTRLTNLYFDTKLKTVSTARNWSTVQKLYSLLHP